MSSILLMTNICSQNNALHFDGINDFIECPSPINGGGDFTFEAWFKSEPNGSGFKRLVSMNGPNSRFELGVDQENIAYFVHEDNTAGTSHTTTSSFVGGVQCHHLASVKSGTDFTLYLDGMQIVFIEDHFANNFSLGGGQTMRLGRWGTSAGEYWTGMIDEVRVWDVARTQSEILATMNVQLFGSEVNLQAYYDFNQGIASGNNMGTILLTDIVNNYDGSLMNFILNGNSSNWISSCSDIVEYCTYECCSSANEGFLSYPLGPLQATLPFQTAGWYKVSGFINMVEDGCEENNSIELGSASLGNFPILGFGTDGGIGGPVLLFEEGKYYCISLCAQISTENSFGNINFMQYDGPIQGYQTILSSQVFTNNDGWINIQLPVWQADMDYSTAFFNVAGGEIIPSSNSDVPIGMQLDNFCMEEVDSPVVCKADFTYEILECGEVCLTDASCGDDYFTDWFLDGNQLSMDASPCFQVDVTGNYTVCLSIGQDDCNDTYCEEIFVEIIDEVAPEITCPVDPIVVTSTSSDGTTIMWPDIVVSDDCGTVNTYCSFDEDHIFPCGETIVWCYAEDNNENIDSCSFLVIVECDPCTPIERGSVIDFEDEDLSVGDEIFDQYDCGSCGIKFYLGDPINNEHPFLAMVGNPTVPAFQGPLGSECGVSSPTQINMPAPGQNIGCFFITDDYLVGGTPQKPINVVYTTPTNKASGDLLDIDGQEEWTITAFDVADVFIAKVILNASQLTSENGIASYWEFNTTHPISRIEFKYTGGSGNVGLGFDNFSACSTKAETELCGKAVVTCFSGVDGISGNYRIPDPNGFVLGIIDIRDRSLAPVGSNWTQASVGRYHHNTWTASNLGEIFGIALDYSGNIYVTGTTIYGSHPYGPLGGGGVYKINALTGTITNLVTIPNGNDPAKGPGLGNLCFSEAFNMLYVSNFYDGLIYCVDANSGSIVTTFDPFIPSNPNLIDDYSFAPLGDRPWAVGINPNQSDRLYFSVWNEHSSIPSNNIVNQIYSVSLDINGYPIGTEVLELDISHFSQNDRSSPIADIAFSSTGRLLIAQRTVKGDIIPDNQHYWAHDSYVIEYEAGSGPNSWIPSIGNISPYSSPIHNKFLVGDPGPGKNSAGGVDYGYESFQNGIPQICDAMVWASGDALSPSHGVGSEPWIYGLQGINASGGNNVSSILIDYNNDVIHWDKTQIGDVEIFKCTSCTVDTTDCTLLDITYNDISTENDTCCYSATITNNIGPDITKICIDLTDSPGWIINTASLSPGYSWDLVTSDKICIENVNGIPQGIIEDVFSFCLSEITDAIMPGDTQCLITSWYKEELKTQCQDTTKVACSTVGEPCLSTVVQEPACNPENDYSYCVCFDITNNSGQDATNLVLDNLTNGFDFIPGCNGSGTSYGNDWAFDPGHPDLPLMDTHTGQFCVNILSSSIINPGTIVDFHATLFNLTKCCSAPALLQLELDPCCDPCKSIYSSIRLIDETSCCYSLDLDYTCGFQYFTKIELDILTQGIGFGYHANGQPADWSMCGVTDQHLCMTPDIAGTIPKGSIMGLLDFCLTDVNKPSEVPQQISIKYYAIDADQKEVVVCDTIIELNCPLSNNSCAFIFNEQIECDVENEKYNISVEVQNLGNPDFDACCLTFPPYSWVTYIDPLEMCFSSPLSNDGSTETVSFCYTPPVFPDSDGIFPVIWWLKSCEGDTCCAGHEMLWDTLYLPTCEPIDTCCSNDLFDQQVDDFLNSITINGCEVCLNPMLLDTCAGLTIQWGDGMGDFYELNETICYTYAESRSYDLCVHVEVWPEIGDFPCLMKDKCETIEVNCNTFTCQNNLVKNAGFIDGIIPGNLPTPGHVDFWEAMHGSPQVVDSDGCTQDGNVQMWGNQATGESIFQLVNFKAGQSYKISFCGKWLDTVQDNVRIRFRGTNGPYSYQNCSSPDCEDIWLSPVLDITWKNYQSVCWTPQFDHSHLLLSIWNDFDDPTDGALVSWARIDDICVTECDPQPCCLDLTPPVDNPFSLQGKRSQTGFDFIDVDAIPGLDIVYIDNILYSGLMFRSKIGTSFGPPINIGLGNLNNRFEFKYPFEYKGDLYAVHEGELVYSKNIPGPANFQLWKFNLENGNPLLLGDLSPFAICDLDNDGDGDMISIERIGTTLTIYYHNGQNPVGNIPKFDSPVILASGIFIPNLEFPNLDLFDGDCDNDCDLYISVVGAVWLFENTGGFTGGIPNISTTSPVINPHGITGIAGINQTEFVKPRFLDFDGDGDAELFIDDNTKIQYYENCGATIDACSCSLFNGWNAVNTTLGTKQCGESAIIPDGFAQDITVSGFYHCQEDCTSGSVVWELQKPNGMTLSGSFVSGVYSFDIPNVEFSDPGSYLLTLSPTCGPNTCDFCVIELIVEPPCGCNGHSDVILTTQNQSYSIDCNFGETTTLHDCPQIDPITSLTGIINCSGPCMATDVTWTLDKNGGTYILGGNPVLENQSSPVDPITKEYIIDLSGVAYWEPGTYSINPLGLCDPDTKCQCYASWIVPESCDCDCLDFYLNPPFIVEDFVNFGSCARQFHLENAGPCDHAEWEWKEFQGGISTVPQQAMTVGDDVVTFTGIDGKAFIVNVKVTRTLINGTTCTEHNTSDIVITNCDGQVGSDDHQFYYDGLLHTVVGDYTLDDDDLDDKIYVSGFGTEEKGLDITLGEVIGHEVNHRSPHHIQDDEGDYFEYKIYGSVNGQDNSLIRTTREEVVMLDGSPYIRWTVDNNNVDNNQLIITSAIGQELANMPIINNEPLYFHVALFDGNVDWLCTNNEHNQSLSNNDQIVFMLPNNNDLLDLPAGSNIEINAIDPTDGINYYSKVEMRWSGVSSDQIYQEKVVMFDDLVSNYALGSVIFDATDQGHRLVLLNVPQNENKGIQISWPYIDELDEYGVYHENTWVYELPDFPERPSLHLEAKGIQGSQVDQNLGRLSLEPFNDGEFINFDKGDLNTDNLTIQLYTDGILEYEIQLPTDFEPIQYSGVIPYKAGNMGNGTDIAFEYDLYWIDPINFYIDDGWRTGDELRIIIDQSEYIELESFTIIPNQFKSFVITDEILRGCFCGPDHYGLTDQLNMGFTETVTENEVCVETQLSGPYSCVSESNSTFTWNWGDGSTDIVSTVAYSACHTYADDPANYEITFTAEIYYIGTNHFCEEITIKNDGTVGTSDEENVLDVHIYPNPTRDLFTINIEIPEAQELQMTLYDIVGQKVIQEDIPKSVELTSFSLASQSAGIYLLEIKTRTGKGFRTKIIKI